MSFFDDFGNAPNELPDEQWSEPQWTSPRRRPQPHYPRRTAPLPNSVTASEVTRSSRHGKRRRSARVRHAVVAALSFTLLLAACAVAVGGVAYVKYNGQITRVAVLNTSDPNIREAASQQHAMNFLVIGSDTRAGANASFGNVSGARSDTTILVHLSPDRSHATVVSIPRDSWVDIPACKDSTGAVIAEHTDMFNSAFAIGGPRCTIATVQKLTGIAVTHFVELDFTGFQKMVNAVHGVTVCSPQNVEDSYSGLRLHTGNNKLNGQQALAYVRARETLGDGSDLGRIKRQQMFLGAVLRQATGSTLLSNPARLTSFLDAATKAIIVDKGTSFGDLRALASSMQGLNPKYVTFYTAPIANQNYSPPGTSMTGRVLLDDVKGRALYDSVIHDAKPVWVTGQGGTTKVVNGGSKAGTTKGTTPTDSTNAATKSCSL